MEDPTSFSSPKNSKQRSMTTRRSGMRFSGQVPTVRLHKEQRGQVKEQALGRKVKETVAKHRILHPMSAQAALSLTTEKPQNLSKPAAKPSSFKLHTEERAARRAGYNDLVTSKINSLEILRRFEDKIQKVLEEEDIKILRKEMVPKAQVMPFFDRPFFPQRSRRPLTVPKEPSFLLKKSCGVDDRYTYYHYFSQLTGESN